MVIAIGGASRSGKTRLTTLLTEHLVDAKILTLCQDDYVYPVSEIPTIRDRVDWECPESINFESLNEDLVNGMANYDHVIIEGFLVFNESKLLQSFDKSIFIDIDKKTFLDRRNKDARWDNEPDWYIEYVWESYLKHGQPSAQIDCLTVKGDATVEASDVLHYIELAHH